MIFVRSEDRAAIVGLLKQWDVQQASADIMGYLGARLLADRENPGQHIIVADFGVVDPDVSAADEATRNENRPETQAWAARLRRHRRRAAASQLRRDLPDGLRSFRHSTRLKRQSLVWMIWLVVIAWRTHSEDRRPAV
jgi:hypothetical protein